mmetsp:Transcript_27701/g.65900  ORF Transcript_27701/g.65900 Transcript_27701/m.65900 type:complete len:282 (+) Transcript_27701:497-1342(+)
MSSSSISSSLKNDSDDESVCIAEDLERCEVLVVTYRSALTSPGALSGSLVGGSSGREESLDCREGRSLLPAVTRLEFAVEVDACPTDSVADSVSTDVVIGRSFVSLLSSVSRSIDMSKGNFCSMLRRLAFVFLYLPTPGSFISSFFKNKSRGILASSDFCLASLILSCSIGESAAISCASSESHILGALEPFFVTREGPPRDEGTPENALLPLYSLPSTIADRSSSDPSGLLTCFNSYVTTGCVPLPIISHSFVSASPVRGGLSFLRLAFSLSSILLSSSK